MAFEPLNFTKNWENPEDFPTYEPNEAQVRADLQLLHEETRAGLNRLVAALNDPGAAAQLPFLPRDGLTAQTVEAAILEVYAAARETAAGQLVDGTVTTQKLAKALLERIYGGRVWVSADTPDETRNPAADFPVGQLWLRPDFTVEDLAAEDWNVSGCAMKRADDGWVLTTDGTQAAVTAEQRLEQAGQPGQTVLVRLAVTGQNDHLVSLTLDLNGVDHDLTERDGLFETALDQSGCLTLTLEAVWPYAEDGETVGLSALTVINTDAAAAAHPGCRLPEDWELFLDRFGLHTERMLFQQTAAGQWTAVDQQILPVERGGTGRNGFESGLLLYGDLRQLPAPETAQCLLSFADGAPRWVTQEQVLTEAGALRGKSGTYEGDGTDREIDLGCTPKLLRVWKVTSAQSAGDGGAEFHGEGSVLLFDGEHASYSKFVEYTVGDRTLSAYSYGRIALKGNVLRLYDSYVDEARKQEVRYFNEAGASYRWLALY